MITLFLNSKKIIPDLYVNTIYDIPYAKLYADGYRLILTDLDNTLISYKQTDPTEELMNWKKEVEGIGFEIIIVSNSKKNRVEYFADILGLKFVKFAKKPLKIGLKKAIKLGKRKYDRKEVLEIGDQLMTDIFGSKRMNLFTILVKAIDRKTEILSTKINRKIEKKMLIKAKKKHLELYNKNLKKYEEDCND